MAAQRLDLFAVYGHIILETMKAPLSIDGIGFLAGHNQTTGHRAVKVNENRLMRKKSII